MQEMAGSARENGGVWGKRLVRPRSGRGDLHSGQRHHEAIYFIRGTDAKGALLEGCNTYTVQFAKDALPPITHLKPVGR